MARKTGEQLKKNLLLLFVAVSVVLVGLTWAENLNEPNEQTSTQMRGVPEAVGPTSAVTLPPGYYAEEHKNNHSGPAETTTETVTVEPPDTATTPLETPTAPPPTSDPFDVTEDQ